MGTVVEYHGLLGLVLKINLETGVTRIEYNGILRWFKENTVSETMELQKKLYVAPGESKEIIVTSVIRDLLQDEIIFVG